MSGTSVAWVYRHSPAKGATFAVHLAIADSVGEGYDFLFWMRQAKLAEKARVTRGTVVRAVDELESAGLITKIEDLQAEGKPNVYRLEMPDAPIVWEQRAEPLRADRAPLARRSRKPLRADRATREPKERTQEEQQQHTEAAAPSAPQPDGAATLFGSPSSKPPRSVEDERAERVARAVWDKLDPRPTGKHAFVNLRRTVKRMLAGGQWTEEDLLLDAPAAWSLSESAITAARKKRLEMAKPVVRKAAPVDRDEEARDFLRRNTKKYANR